MSPFFDGTLIELGAGGADVTVKKDGTCFFVITQFYGGVSERTGDHFSFVTEVELGEPYRDLGFFPGNRLDQFDFMSGSLLMVLIASVSDGGQHLLGANPIFLVLSMAGIRASES